MPCQFSNETRTNEKTTPKFVGRGCGEGFQIWLFRDLQTIALRDKEHSPPRPSNGSLAVLFWGRTDGVQTQLKPNEQLHLFSWTLNSWHATDIQCPVFHMPLPKEPYCITNCDFPSAMLHVGHVHECDQSAICVVNLAVILFLPLSTWLATFFLICSHFVMCAAALDICPTISHA